MAEMKIIAKIEACMVDNWRYAWRWASTYSALFIGAFGGWAATDPAGFQIFVSLMPPWVRPLIGMAIAGAFIGPRLIKQKEPPHGER